MTSELYKIAFVHLYVQGYRDEALTNFELSLTTPSIIYDQERIALLKEKVDLAAQIMDTNLLPTDWIYDNIFHLSEDQYDEYRDMLREDAKRRFRMTQIENEGNDPMITGKSYGTPHDIATAYGKGRVYDRPGNVPDGYNEGEPKLGRPKEKASFVNTQNDPLGRDRLGAKDAKIDDQADRPKMNGYTNNLSLEQARRELGKHERVLSQIPSEKQVLIFEQNKEEGGLLDERQIKE